MADVAPFKLLAGQVALDFANTLDNRPQPERLQELLASYSDLTRFALQAQIATPGEVSALLSLPARDKHSALAEARELREIIHKLFSAAARNERIARPDLAVFNAFLRRAQKHRLLNRERQSIHWTWRNLSGDSAGPLWPITLAAAELLTSPHLEYVRECGSESCRWLFLDLSKNHTRRWCDMKLCGNRTKARRYYQAHN